MPGKDAEKPDQQPERPANVGPPCPARPAVSWARTGDPSQAVAIFTARSPLVNRPIAHRLPPTRARDRSLRPTARRPWPRRRPGRPAGSPGTRPSRSSANAPSPRVADRPGKQEHGLDVEDHEHQGVDVILDPKPHPGFAVGLHAALVGVALGQRSLARARSALDQDRRQAEDDRHEQEQADEDVVVEDHVGLGLSVSERSAGRRRSSRSAQVARDRLGVGSRGGLARSSRPGSPRQRRPR